MSWDEREVPFDLLVTIPLHGGPAYVGSVTHFEGDTLVENIRRFLDGEESCRRRLTDTPTASSRPASTRRC